MPLPQRISVFDLDRTLVTGNSSFAFCRYLVARGVLPRQSLGFAALCFFKHVYCGMSLPALHNTIFNHLLRGKPLELLESHVAPFVEKYLARYTNAATIAALRLAQHLGDHTLILSNGPQFLIKGFAKAWNVDAWRSTEYCVDKHNHLVEISSLLLGEDKAACLQETMAQLNVKRDQVTAYSDSYLDLPLLLAAGNPVAVNPDRKLRKISQINRWKVL